MFKKALLLFVFFVFGGLNLIHAKETASDELIIGRLNAMRSPLDFSYNPAVKPFIDEYLNNPDLVRQLLLRAKVLFPIIEKHLKAKGVPADLKFLAATASYLDPNAVNAAGGSGLWQMAYPVSKMYKLKVNTYVDDRRDINRSCQVAAQHFKDLFSIYKSWPLAIAAYGCSPVMLNKCIRMANSSLYYWDVYPQMPTYCRDLYPKLVATAYILNYHREHGIKLLQPELVQPEPDSVLVTKWLSFQQIANTTGITIEELRALNPRFRKDIVPFTAEGYYIKVPKNKVKEFENLKDSVYVQSGSDLSLEPIDVKKDNTRTSSAGEESPTDKQVKAARVTGSNARVIYKVKRGDNLTDIADWFDVEIDELKTWNKMRSNKILYGQALKIYVPSSKSGYYKRINSMSVSQKRKIANKD